MLLRGEVRMRGWSTVRRGRRLWRVEIIWGVGIREEAGREGQVRGTGIAPMLPTHGAETRQTPGTAIARRGGHCQRVGLTHKEFWCVLRGYEHWEEGLYFEQRLT